MPLWLRSLSSSLWLVRLAGSLPGRLVSNSVWCGRKGAAYAWAHAWILEAHASRTPVSAGAAACPAPKAASLPASRTDVSVSGGGQRALRTVSDIQLCRFGSATMNPGFYGPPMGLPPPPGKPPSLSVLCWTTCSNTLCSLQASQASDLHLAFPRPSASLRCHQGCSPGRRCLPQPFLW